MCVPYKVMRGFILIRLLKCFAGSKGTVKMLNISANVSVVLTRSPGEFSEGRAEEVSRDGPQEGSWCLLWGQSAKMAPGPGGRRSPGVRCSRAGECGTARWRSD